MRILLIITCLANIAFAFGSLPWMPNPMAVRLASDGTPMAFVENPIKHAMLVSISVGIMATVFLYISRIYLFFCPSGMPFMPNRDYWLSEENRPKMILRIHSFFDSGGFGTMLFFVIGQWVFFQANLGAPPTANLIVLFFGISVIPVFIAVVMVRLYLSFRLPKEND